MRKEKKNRVNNNHLLLDTILHREATETGFQIDKFPINTAK